MLIIEIHSTPKPQKQTRFHLQKGKFFASDPSKTEKEQIQWQVRPYAPQNPFTGPIHLELTFLLPIPTTATKIMKKGMSNGIVHHLKRPDIDNLSYLIVNALKGIIYEDDCQIVDLNLHKRYGEEAKTIVKVWEI